MKEKEEKKVVQIHQFYHLLCSIESFPYFVIHKKRLSQEKHFDDLPSIFNWKPNLSALFFYSYQHFEKSISWKHFVVISIR